MASEGAPPAPPALPDVNIIDTLQQKMNKTVSASGGEVFLRRRDMDTGELLPGEVDKQHLEYQCRFSRTVEMLKTCSYSEKLTWALERKAEGNRLFALGRYDDAVKSYLDSLMGLDFGDSETDAATTRRRHQVPILTNLAACYLHQEAWAKAAKLCTEAISLAGDDGIGGGDLCSDDGLVRKDVASVATMRIKALMRRGQANTRLRRFVDADADLRRALSLANAAAAPAAAAAGAAGAAGAGGDTEPVADAKVAQSIKRQIHALKLERKKARDERRKEKEMCRKMMAKRKGAGGIYAEKDDVEDSSDDDGEESGEEDLAVLLRKRGHEMAWWRRWLLTILLWILLAVRGVRRRPAGGGGSAKKNKKLY